MSSTAGSETTTRTSLVDRRIVRNPSDELVDAALAAQHVRPKLLGALGERVVVLCFLDDPVFAAELVLELSRAPARIAGEHAPARCGRHDLFGVVESRESQRAEERYCRIVRIDELAEDEHRVRLHGAAEP